MLPIVEIDCPYCGERFSTTADPSAGAQEYIEDCQVCCRPITLSLETDIDGNLAGIRARREDD